MSPSLLILGEALANRCAQVLYRCLEEVGSTKGVLYLRAPDGGSFEVVSCYGWPRGAQPPVSIPQGHPLLAYVHRERRTFAVNEASGMLDLSAFAEGGDRFRFLITPVYLAGDWVGLLIQRDPIKGGTFLVERDEPSTLAICSDLVEALREFRLYGVSPKPVSGPVPGLAPDSPGFPSPAPHQPLPPAPGPQERVYGSSSGQQGLAPAMGESGPTLSSWVAPPPKDAPRKRGVVTPELRAYFWEVAALINQILPVSAVALWMEDPEEIRPVLTHSDVPLSEDLRGQVLAHAALHLPRVEKADLRLLTCVAREEAPEISGTFSTYLPLMLNETPRGHDLLLLFMQEGHGFSMSAIESVQPLARILALHLQEARLHERYYHSFLSVCHRILQSSETRLPGQRSHGLATARLARDLALKLELPTEEVEAVSIAALLHVLKLIRHHHERWDGRGYPEGLRETSIPLGSRIIGLIGAYEVMTSGKSYRPPRGHRQALEELGHEAGGQFDPKVVEAFRELLARKGEQG